MGSEGSVGSRAGGTGEKWVNEAPERSSGRRMEGGMKVEGCDSVMTVVVMLVMSELEVLAVEEG